MARFRAYTSDNSDEGSTSESDTQGQHVNEEEAESESDQESSGNSSSSEMQEEELFTSPSRPSRKPNRNALVEDEDGEIRYAHEVEDGRRIDVRVSPASSSSTSPPSRNRGDPTIIPWAQHVGVDAQKMHVMQTSLFRMPEEAAALRAMNQPTKPNLRVPLQPLNRKHSRDSDGDGLRFDPREVSFNAASSRFYELGLP
jgi:nuclear pore complex protein Nup98-Nup96